MNKRVAVIGAGPAGLMASEQLAARGYSVHVFDAMPSVARKFLLAGIGGMNITHSEEYELFVSRYREAAANLKPMLDAFNPAALREWIKELGIDTFVGTSGRVFPTDMKAAPLLRAWLQRLRSQGIQFHPRHRWLNFDTHTSPTSWIFQTPNGVIHEQFDAVVLALGGASWPKLGSDGSWQTVLTSADIELTPLSAANCGFEIPWSDYLKEKFAGTPIKHIRVGLTDINGNEESRTGEFIVSQYGIEGSLIYALSAPLRDLLNNQPNQASIWIDWLPHSSIDQVITKLQQPRKGMSFSNVLRKKLNLPAITNALLKECYPTLDLNNSEAVAAVLKHMQLPNVVSTRPIEEAISSAGGVPFFELNSGLMLNKLPGVFIAGEMLDWDAPTGGYLLTACFATGKWAGNAAADWLASF